MSTLSPPDILPLPIRNGPLVSLDTAVFAESFNKNPFRVQHALADHPLFTLPRLVELSQTLPADRVEYNAGNLPITQDPTLTPQNGLSIEETIRRIEECRSWLVLKNVEQDPEYAELLRACLAEVERQPHPDVQGVCLREAYVFITSPGSVTPYHIDHELNFLLQVRGSKCITIFPEWDRFVISEEDLERFYCGAHRNLIFNDEQKQRGQPFEIHPGEGVHVPVTAPHWVQNGPEVSISFSITMRTRATERRGMIYQFNHWLRGRGWKPTPYGQSRWRDSFKFNTFRILHRLGRLWPGGKKETTSKY